MKSTENWGNAIAERLPAIICMAGCFFRLMKYVNRTSSQNAESSIQSETGLYAGEMAEEGEDITINIWKRGCKETQELYIDRDGMRIYGRLYLPKEPGSSALPLVILSHWFGGNYRHVESYAEYFAENNIAAFAYDFIGGGYGSKSDGTTSEMSVLTEAADLNAVLNYFRAYPGIDRDHIFLFGESQGGFVSAYVAGIRPEDVAGLVLLYPAFVLQDDSRRRNPDPENAPAYPNMWGIRLGKIYDVDAQSFDIYNVMKSYHGKVLIIHGTSDSVVPLSYSQRAVWTFPDAELITLSGADHGFYGSDQQRAKELSLQLVKGLL